MERIKIEQALDLINILIEVLLSKPRSQKVAELLLFKNRIKIEYFFRKLFLSFSSQCGLGSFEGRFCIPREFIADNGYVDYEHFNVDNFSDDVDDIIISHSLIIEMMKIFSVYLKNCFCSTEQGIKIINNKRNLSDMIDDLFNINPATNLFEFSLYTSTLPQSSFKEVIGGYGILVDEGKTLVCIDEKICNYHNLKSGEKFGDYSFVGIASHRRCGKNEELNAWLVNEEGRLKGKVIRIVVEKELRNKIIQISRY